MTTKAEILKVIRLNCLDCVVGQVSIIEDWGGEKSCKLYPFRFGKDPAPAKSGKTNLRGFLEMKKLQIQKARNPSILDDRA